MPPKNTTPMITVPKRILMTIIITTMMMTITMNPEFVDSINRMWDSIITTLGIMMVGI